MIDFDLIIKNDNGKLTLNEHIEKLLDNYKEAKEKIDEMEKSLREAILKAMIINNIVSSKIGKYTISQVIPKDIIKFDKDSFILNENEDVVKAVSEIIENETFDIESFKKENPNLYNKYLIKDVDVEIDEKKLSKFLPDTYNKYITTIKSDKPISLRIAGK